MVMINVTPRKPSIVGMVVGAALFVIGVYLLFNQWDQLKALLLIFAGFFLLLLGLGIFFGALARRVYRAA
jgi:hypothetical protein